MRRPLPAALALALAAGLSACGSAGTPPKTITSTTPAPAAKSFRGTTGQGQPVTLAVTGPNVLASVKFSLSCGDGSSTSATLTSHPAEPRLAANGSFYYQEKGREPSGPFPGYGAGHYRGAIAGTVTGPTAHGTAAFRITFKETACRASTTWTARRS